MSCRCDTVTELYGDEAEGYAAEHLHAEPAGAGELEQRFACPDTGRRWTLDYPDRRGDRELGQARLAADPA